MNTNFAKQSVHCGNSMHKVDGNFRWDFASRIIKWVGTKRGAKQTAEIG